MSAAIKTGLLCIALLASPASAQDMSAPQQINRWQDLGPYIAAQTAKINEQGATIKLLSQDMGLVVARYDMLLRAILVNVCAANKAMTENAWAAKLAGLKPIPVGDYDCATDGTGDWYIPTYLHRDGPPIPPADPGSTQ